MDDFFLKIPLQIIVDRSKGCSNALFTDEKRLFIQIENILIHTQAHRERDESSDTPTNPFFVEATAPLPPIVAWLEPEQVTGRYRVSTGKGRHDEEMIARQGKMHRSVCLPVSNTHCK